MRITRRLFLALTLLGLFGCEGASDAGPESREQRAGGGVESGNWNRKAKSQKPKTENRKPKGKESQPSIAHYRPPDQRPEHDEQRLAEAGIGHYESRRLKLYTDIDPERARRLPPLIDQAFQAWEAYFGPLPANREGTPYQITGYIMDDNDLFRRLGLLPADLPGFLHGRHKGARFWMNEQQYAYYRRHLMIHEATHCFMTVMPEAEMPVWYFEGMAELFGTHRLDESGNVRFRVMPGSEENFAGHGRIAMIQDACRQGNWKSIADVGRLRPNDYLENTPYAWSWALCTFLDRHPAYRESFRQLGRRYDDGQFEATFQAHFADHMSRLEAEWWLFTHNLQYGYDIERAAVDFQPGDELTADNPERTVRIAAEAGWQSSGVRLQQDRLYEVTASGRFTLAQKPKPWISEPQGISFRYFDGRPLGRLLGGLRREIDDPATETLIEILSLGRQKRFRAPRTATLYLRLNDSWSELADNAGTVQVRIRAVHP